MERTVPSTASEEIDLYVRTYYSLLRSTDEIQIKSLEETHAGVHSLLHVDVRDPRPDLSALAYTAHRLPDCIRDVRLVVLGQSADAFQRRGFGDVESWQRVTARARRRRSFYDGDETLAVFIASRSDIDDLIPILTAYQIVWNKIHYRLQDSQLQALLKGGGQDGLGLSKDQEKTIASALSLKRRGLERIRSIWSQDWASNLLAISQSRKRMALRLLGGSLVDYRKATQRWWDHIAAEIAPLKLLDRPVYFVSSNSHSIANLLSGHALHDEELLLDYLERCEQDDLLAEYGRIRRGEVPSARENLLYYALKHALENPGDQEIRRSWRADEALQGIRRVPSQHVFDVEAQVVELCRLRPDRFDPRLKQPGIESIGKSDAVILNIDYPLGMAAYQILAEIAQHIGEIRGVYVLGKAASLNGGVGDVVIPNVVHDEHSRNTFLFQNCFRAADVVPFLEYGTVLDNQKAISVLGTFLQNRRFMDVFYREGYTDIEMEAGPYLSAIYEMVRPKRHPVDEIVDLHFPSFDIGVLHYVSDTPLTRGQNLGAQNLAYYGLDATYATSIAVLRRIFGQEMDRL